MKNQQAEPLANRDGPEEGRGVGIDWTPGVRELLDHIAQELALEYVRLMEQAAEAEEAIPDQSEREED